MKGLLFVVAVAACSEPHAMSQKPAWVASTDSANPSAPAPIAAHYREVATRIIAAARADRGAFTKLSHLTDRIGNRIAGSANLEAAVAWGKQAMADDGHDARTEAVMVPHWVRGPEAAELVAPIARPLRIIGLGYSVPTPRGGITAPVVVVTSWAELDAKRDAVKGAIVLYDVAMPAYSEDKGSGYGETVEYRTQGAIRAAKLGAVATLMRSVTAHSLRLPHTGAVRYDDAVPKIPAAAVTVEDAALLSRLAASGGATVHLALESQMLPDVASANVIGELRGKDKPDEVVVIGAHLDSWDVGQGAHDDGAGVVTMMQALTTLRRLGLQPRRTIRVVLFVNEENGINGAKAYAKDHAGELDKTVAALEADSGGFAPRGFSIGKPDPAKDKWPDKSAAIQKHLADLATLLAPLGATRATVGHGGADISPMAPAGVPQIGLDTDGRTYFDIHHTDADTLDKVDPKTLADDVAAAAVFAYVVADLPGRIDE